MNRRHFIKNTGQFGLALSLLHPMAEYLTEQDFMNSSDFKPFFKLSLAQWSLHKAINETKTLSPLDFAKTAKGLGFQGIEYVAQLYEIDKKNELASVKKLVKELKLRSNDNGIENVIIMVDNEGDLASMEQKDRDLAVHNHTKWIDAAVELNCPTIRVNLFGTESEKDFKVWKETSMDSLSKLSEYAAKSKINVAIENHGGLSSDAGKLMEVVKAVNNPYCGTLPDFGNFCIKRENGERWGSPCIEEYDKYLGIAEMMPFAKGVSAKSYDFDDNGNETTIDYYKMLKIVKDAKFDGFIGVEYEGNNLGEIEGILATKKLLLKVAASI
ncbi:sugar phosphate isomerase/epimerase [Flavobacterium arsenatis]|uniref:Sugar phosphate isomerase/epimerase n=1 Tax=Flavobacterium arsenatis TaxID=1484332 RepID=A0ABU1TP25_9FLAO|nr:sugar phosphate isomerase/epimerase family protein [Flavobacterium arsenatis]MDR6967727.1 sugar phosphate isomerase/epimerase [Flavobacterium arsenatis]